jgi:hypothetical protein
MQHQCAPDRARGGPATRSLERGVLRRPAARSGNWSAPRRCGCARSVRIPPCAWPGPSATGSGQSSAVFSQPISSRNPTLPEDIPTVIDLPGSI